MILDDLLEMSDAQVPTVTANSTDIIDRGAQAVLDNALTDIGTGEDVYWVVSVQTVFAGGTSLQASLVTDTNPNLATAPVTIAQTPVIPLASLVPGYQYAVKLPAGTYKQYLGTIYTIVGTMSGGGSVNSFITKDAQNYRAYADRTPIAGVG